MSEETLKKLRQMKLYGMANALETNLANTQRESLSCDELISVLIDAEHDDRSNRRITRSIKNAHFRYNASIEELHFDVNRNIDRTLINRLASCKFISKAENILISGSTGVGKSFIASAFGNQACVEGYKVFYSNTKRLFARLKMSKAEGSYLKELAKLEKIDLLILDDFGLLEFDSFSRNALVDMIEDRHGRKSTIIASQLPIALWYEVIGEDTVADMVMDRLVYNAYRLELEGDNLRKRQNKKPETRMNT